ncbi:MAG: FHA domain-containing protein, partial [Vicinamibacterales bacterium]|nr:FHA domain-containing protein [Vicinamibacterales bacterium]
MQTLDLNIARGPGEGQTIRLPGDRAFAIGRSHSADLTLDDREVSSHHARIQVEGGYFVLADLNSKNHTYVNGEQITGAVILRDRDQIALGDCVLVVREAGNLSVTLSESPDTQPVRASIETSNTMAVDLPTIKTAITTLGRSEKTLAVLHAASKLLLESHEPAVFLPRLLDLMFEVVPADRGVVFLLERGELQPLHARDAKGQVLRNLTVSRSMIQLRRLRFSWTRIRGESDVQGGRRHGS